jgi:spore coat protein H
MGLALRFVIGSTTPRSVVLRSVSLPCSVLLYLALGCGKDGALIIVPDQSDDEGEATGLPSMTDGAARGNGSGAATGRSSSPLDNGLANGPGGVASSPDESGASTAPVSLGTNGSAVGAGVPGVVIPDDAAQAWVFDEAAVHTYELTLDPAVWALLQANARDEQYAEADFYANGQTLGRIGLRFKGSLGTLESCFEDDGTPRCSKMSMKLRFDQFLPEQRFAGLKRLNFNSMLYDDSLMHERLAYRVFREMGIVAPRAVHARLIINGEDHGLFTLVEDVDGRFTKSHFDDGDGNLYKEAWPSDADADVLAGALTTNEEVANHSGILGFQAALLAATPDEQPAVLERYVDVDQLLAYLAVDRTLVNWDGIAAFYCYDGFCENHNYFWYQDEAEARFRLIPWDLDNTFEQSPLAAVPDVFDIGTDCSALYMEMGRTLRAPGCDPILQGLVRSGGARYVSQLDRLLGGPFAPGVLEGWIDELEAQLQSDVATDSRGPGLETFEVEVERLRLAVEDLRRQAEVDRAAHL